MAVVVYPALITKAERGLHARFVDFTASGVNAESTAELIRLAREWLHAELLRLEGEGETWPEPTAVEQLTPPPGGLAVLVDVSVEDTPVRLTVSIGERLLKRIDEDAQARSMTRSGYLALGARRLLGDVPDGAAGLGGETGRKIQAEIDGMARRLTETLGPESSFGRTLADLDARATEGMSRLGEHVRAAMRARRADQPAPPPEPEQPRADG